MLHKHVSVEKNIDNKIEMLSSLAAMAETASHVVVTAFVDLVVLYIIYFYHFFL